MWAAAAKTQSSPQYQIRQSQPSQQKQQIQKQTHQTQSSQQYQIRQSQQSQQKQQAQQQTQIKICMEPVNPLRHIITTPILYSEKKRRIQVKFQCDASLTGFVVGRHRNNIAIAKKVEGVTDIDIRNIDTNTSECIIIATNKYAATEAKNILEIIKDFVLVPREAVGLLIGSHGANINKIKQTSNVIKIKVASSDEKNGSKSDYSGCDRLVIIGRKKNVSMAKQLINSHVEETKEQWNAFLRQSQRRRRQRGGRSNLYNIRGRGRGCRGGYRENRGGYGR